MCEKLFQSLNGGLTSSLPRVLGWRARKVVGDQLGSAIGKWQVVGRRYIFARDIKVGTISPQSRELNPLITSRQK